MHRFISSTPRKRPSPTDDGDNRSQPVLKAPTTATVSEPVPVTTATTSPCGSISAPKETSAPSTSARNMGTPKDISQTPEEGPRKGFLKAYPTRLFGNQQRAFSEQWVKRYEWIEYSVGQDAVFCFPCRHFVLQHSTNKFITQGFQNWKKGLEKLQAHDQSVSHRQAMEAWAEYKRTSTGEPSIEVKASKPSEKLIADNRHYIKAVVETLKLTATQCIAQRGDNETTDSNNRGNFLEILTLIGKFDQIVGNRIESGPQNAKYTHKDIQNELIDIISSMIREEICEEVRKAEVFCLMVDETKDVSKKEQISFVVRYMLNSAIREEFLHFVPADGLDAASLLKTIKETLANMGIPIDGCIAQCYDGASVMSGKYTGVQELFKQEVPHAVYVHCYAHRLNLVLVDCVHNIEPVARCFEVVQQLYNFFSGSVVHDIFLQKQRAKSGRLFELKKLSDTRWSCQHAALTAIINTLPVILETLEEVSTHANINRSTKATSLIPLIDWRFVLNLIVLEGLFGSAKRVSDILQSPELDFASANDLIQDLIDELKEKRCEKKMHCAWVEAQTLCQELEIPYAPTTSSLTTPTPRSRRMPKHLDDFVVDTTTGVKESVSTEEKYRSHVFFEVLARMGSELKRRFSDSATNIMKGVCALEPQSPDFLDCEKIRPMAINYGVQEDDLRAEVHALRRLVARKQKEKFTMEKTIDLYKLL